MKSVFIIIHSMGSGGAEKSLLSFLKCMKKNGLDKEYSIDLMVVYPIGIFMDQIPDFVNVVKADPATIWMGVDSKSSYLKENFSLVGLYGKLKCFVQKKLGLYRKSLNSEQQLWHSWNKLIPNLKKQYDVAISYLNGFPNYYVMDKVAAKKKVLWIHNEYQKLNYDPSYDSRYYNDCDRIITISQECVNSFIEVFPELKDKIAILENISISADVLEKSQLYVPDELKGDFALKLVSVGRLAEQKGFDLAIEAAKLIKDKIPDFLWVILGEGPYRGLLEKQISDYCLEENMKLLGIRDNPYVYIKNADIFVQPSRFEGKSVVLDEAKILQKPIVVTSYPTVCDSITDLVNGSVVELNPQAIAEGVLNLASDKTCQQRYIDNLKNMNYGNENEIQKYISVML